MTVADKVGKYRKLAQIDRNPGEYHVYQDSPEPESIKVACMPGQDLYPRTVRLRIFIRPTPTPGHLANADVSPAVRLAP